MLTDTTFVSVAPQQAFQQIDLLVEGYSHNDASLLVQIISNDGLPAEEFLMSRTATSETLGAMINESKFAKFGINELQSLMSAAVSPTIDDLVGKTFVCSSYTRLDSVKLDLKSRTYSSPSPGVLQSHSDLQGPTQTWAASPFGIELKIDNSSGCGRFTTRNVVRLTGAGNLISEVVLDLENFLLQCESVGFDKEKVRAVETNSTYPSVLDPKMVADSYEFCHPAN
jgi:hypothetical protein